MELDVVVNDHNPQNLEKIFNAKFVYQNPHYSLLIKETQIKWFVLIPNQTMSGENSEYIKSFYGSAYQLADHLKAKGFGQHYNLAKIGNKLPYLHIHLVFRSEEDEAWPDAIWCHEPLKPGSVTALELKSIIEGFSEK